MGYYLNFSPHSTVYTTYLFAGLVISGLVNITSAYGISMYTTYRGDEWEAIKWWLCKPRSTAR